eukprot:TRINITY_DN4073_c0_g1_i8.p1 TRINITY_DN4073_c0_g1~~TRINITY_DN4073_c0_g1_i8.p1  ORF type:complete len:197 (+),score=-10.76 TRINITY_DN4073_c0_g1_i8:718-1308(+)
MQVISQNFFLYITQLKLVYQYWSLESVNSENGVGVGGSVSSGHIQCEIQTAKCGIRTINRNVILGNISFATELNNINLLVCVYFCIYIQLDFYQIYIVLNVVKLSTKLRDWLRDWLRFGGYSGQSHTSLGLKRDCKHCHCYYIFQAKLIKILLFQHYIAFLNFFKVGAISSLSVMYQISLVLFATRIQQHPQMREE